mmetsp:Transcript_38499/g.78620  ORF Transcript_38499/g.78620 Transcript_38499/m.78620 type:complete len:105 (+) Transcript_38499:790-1104(+)
MQRGVPRGEECESNRRMAGVLLLCTRSSTAANNSIQHSGSKIAPSIQSTDVIYRRIKIFMPVGSIAQKKLRWKSTDEKKNSTDERTTDGHLPINYVTDFLIGVN